MFTHRRTRLITALALSLALWGAACGSDSDSDDDASKATTTAAASEDATSADDDGAATVPSDLPLDAVVRGLEVAMDPEEIRVEGDTLHIYIAEDSGKVPAGTECTIVSSVLPDGATAIIYRGDDETTC